MHDATFSNSDGSAPAKGAQPVPLPLRHDTILGVCQGLSEDLGINANLLRVALGSIVLFNPMLAAGIYAVLGLVVGASRLIFPDRAVAMADGAQVIREGANDQAPTEQIAA